MPYSQGPGAPTGRWATTYSNTTNPPARGRGHRGSDAHSMSIAAGADEARHLWKAAYPHYLLNTSRPGTNFAAAPWMIPEMGFDRLGHARVEYSIGPYEAGASAGAR